MKTAVTSFATEHTVATVCPLDCPDSCSLDVTVQEGKGIIKAHPYGKAAMSAPKKAK